MHTSYYFARHKVVSTSVTSDHHTVPGEWVGLLWITYIYLIYIVSTALSVNNITTNPLPDIFTGCVIHLWGCGADEERKLTRYIVAYPLTLATCTRSVVLKL